MILDEIKNIKESKKDLRKFGLMVGFVLFALAGFLFWKGKTSYPVFGVTGVLLILTGTLFPIALKPLNKIWMTLAILMGWVMTRLILTILFFIVLTPLAFVARIFGKKFLDLKIDKNRKSYWEKRAKKELSSLDYENQF
jgi:Saxitoxin biosynthesis operon protein SxtJ